MRGAAPASMEQAERRSENEKRNGRMALARARFVGVVSCRFYLQAHRGSWRRRRCYGCSI